MPNNNITSKPYSFKDFLTEYHVVIPMVQRDYAQGRTSDDVNRVRNRFLDAIKECLDQTVKPIKMMKMDFVYGEHEEVYSSKKINSLEKIIITPLDGQQRLTTLYLLHWFAARKANVRKEDYAFLTHFTYDIRPSSRDFCTHLVDFVPKNTEVISSQIIDQPWFMAEWHNDPTVLSMLVMLDAIKEKFDIIDNLWDLLTAENRIIFYYLPLSDNGLSDELYIKMNSRGKKLTSFEHFKAEYEALYDRDTKESNEINHKFDVEWIDVLFPYRDETDNTVDREFMRYFFYISHILCYKQNIKRSDDEFELIKLLYDSRGADANKNARNNKDYLMKALDCWYNVLKNGGIDVFFKKYFTDRVYEKNKVATYKSSVREYGGCQNFFNACVKLYQVNNNFSYGDFLFLYGIITYLINRDDKPIQESVFIERLRVLRNLIMNSNAGEIRKEAMGDLLDEVETLMLDGIIKEGLSHSFNGFQEQEEREKMAKKATMTPGDVERMYRFEDHPLIYGYVTGLGYDHLDLVDAFYELFLTNNYMLIHRAMISIGDYRQKDNNRYYMGNNNSSTWTSLLHKSKARDWFDKTMAVLIELLQKLKSGKKLQGIIDNYIQEQEQLKEYSWRYYFAKYEDMLRGGDGELVWSDKHTIITLNKHQFNGKHWNSFLNVVYNEVKEKYDKDVVRLDNYGENLSILKPVSSLGFSSDGFIYYQGMEQNPWKVNQTEYGVDTEDRIQMAVYKICDLINQNSKQ